MNRIQNVEITNNKYPLYQLKLLDVLVIKIYHIKASNWSHIRYYVPINYIHVWSPEKAKG